MSSERHGSREVVQKTIHQDWANREYIEVITASIKRISDFLNSFGTFFVFICDSLPKTIFIFQTCLVALDWLF